MCALWRLQSVCSAAHHPSNSLSSPHHRSRLATNSDTTSAPLFPYATCLTFALRFQFHSLCVDNVSSSLPTDLVGNVIVISFSRSLPTYLVVISFSRSLPTYLVAISFSWSLPTYLVVSFSQTLADDLLGHVFFAAHSALCS